MVRLHELSDREGSIIEPLLLTDTRGVLQIDDRRVLNGILWRFRTGSPWADVPERYGPHKTCYNRFTRWTRAGHWAHILEAISGAYDDLVMIDSSANARSSTRGHGLKKRGQDHGMGRSRGGLTPKLHALVEGQGRLVKRHLSPGNDHDVRGAEVLIEAIKPGQTLLADKAYDAQSLLRAVMKQKAKANRLRPRPFDQTLYKQRNVVERFFAKIKQYRGLATRYDKLKSQVLGRLTVAAIRISLKSYESTA